MEFAVFVTLPGLVILLTALAFGDQILRATGRGRRSGQISSTGFEQLHATFSQGKQNELKERQSSLVMRDDEEDGAPPHRSTVDLTGGRAVIRVPSSARPASPARPTRPTRPTGPTRPSMP